MELWQKQLSQSAVKVKDLPFIPESKEYREKLEQVRENYPIRINSYFLDQIKSSNDPLWRQVVSTLEELDDFIQEDLISDPPTKKAICLRQNWFIATQIECC